MEITIQMDAMGSIHIWDGDGELARTDKYLWEMDGREADYYLQFESDKNLLMGKLHPEFQQAVDDGWHVVVSVDDGTYDWLQGVNRD